MSEAAANGGARVARTPGGTAYTEAGQGRPIVFVHGVGMNRAVWAPQVAHFAATHRVIAYDLLGHGDSPLPPDPTGLDDLRRQLEELLDALDIDATRLVGHSMGALVAVDFALAHPGRVTALVALNAVYRRSPGQRDAVLERARRLADGEGGDILDETLGRWFGAESVAAGDGPVERVRAWLQGLDARGYARVYDCFARSDDAFAGRLEALQAPALFATGEHDPNSTPEMSRMMAAESPAGEAEVLPGQRHMMAFADPAAVNPVLERFIERNGDRGGAGTGTREVRA